MVIKSYTMLRNKYTIISDMAHKNDEPIYITKNGEGDLVVMSVEAFEKKEQMIKFKEKLLFAEQERLNDEPTQSPEEVRKSLKKRCYEKNQD